MISCPGLKTGAQAETRHSVLLRFSPVASAPGLAFVNKRRDGIGQCTSANLTLAA